MTAITAVTVQNIRTHENFSLRLSPNVTVITGKNGSGKTSLIEAMYIALQGTSFKGSDNDVLRHNQPWWRITMKLDDDTTRVIKFDPLRSSGKKQFVIDQKTSYRLPAKYKYPVVLFEPDDLRLLHGSPTRRRHFIDHFISQLDSLYAVTLRKYDRALKQRNNLLKKPDTTPDELFVWDVALSEYGAYIIEQRVQFIEQINSHLNEAYNTIAQSNDVVSIHYSHTVIGTIKQKMLQELHASSERDKHLGFTSIGPHRHDVIFRYNNAPALSVASRGEVRSVVLALKFLEVDIIERLTGKKPIVLLDDVFSELDESRQAALMKNSLATQLVIATTNNHQGSEPLGHEVRLSFDK
ncbi:MAG TPA: DNA replication and repair protein RecF [Candidatus Saccharimonadales bacterium]|nr:DNA replication and repair protein RecF [Candidatus Saccharimonadales bacterium]